VLQALAIRFVPHEDLGCLYSLLHDEGYQIHYADVGSADFAALDPLEPDLLIVLGGPLGADDDAHFPWLKSVLALLRDRLRMQMPTLGICLGAQLMGRALGARLHRGDSEELGFAPVRLTEAGVESCLRPLAEPDVRVLHWHSDRVELPHGAVRLAETPRCGNQAFAVGNHTLALQFHLELDPHHFERWLVHAPLDEVNRLRAEQAEHGSALARLGREIIGCWLEGLGRGQPAA